MPECSQGAAKHGSVGAPPIAMTAAEPRFWEKGLEFGGIWRKGLESRNLGNNPWSLAV